jgi:ribonuclease J
LDLKERKNELLFLPLGGAKEIGMNLNLYHYQGKWLMVDLGAGFADDYFPGVDLIVPDISFLDDKKKDLLGLVLTHAHEDHLGAVQYLWHYLRCPIYTTPFTHSFLKAKLTESDFKNEVKIHEIKEGSKFELAPFSIELVPITHSTPEMQGLMIRTNVGNIFHTGDWKFDPQPLVGNPTDLKKLKQLGNEGVLALVGDSTNVFNKEPSGSEGDLRESLTQLISSCKKAVVVTTFASNVARFETIIKAAEKCNRKVALAGKSLWRILDAARESGYLNTGVEFVNEDHIADIPRENLLIISTGCQGEPLAATTKMALGTHPYLRLAPGDNVIFSSKIIPGNEKRIFRLFNQLVKLGVEIFTERDHFVHVSGHPSSQELKKMYELIKPNIAIPVHGELVHIHEHARLAKEWGVPHCLQIENGVISKLAPGEPHAISIVQSGYLGVDGNYLLPSDAPVLRMRRKIQKDGIIIIILVMNKKGKLLSDPIFKSPGCLDPVEDEQLIYDITTDIWNNLTDYLSQNRISEETVKNITRQTTRKLLREEIGKNPIIDITISYVD